MNEFDTYLDCVDADVDIQYGRLSLCNLKHYMPGYSRKRIYQVHCDDSNEKYSQIFEHPEHAIIKFIELKRKIRPLWRGNKQKKR
jgi:hypothetical protein